MAEIELTVKQIMNLGLWDKVCEYKGWNEYLLNEGLIEESELVTLDDEFKKDTKWEIEYAHCTDELVDMSEKASVLTENEELKEIINSLASHACTALKYEIIVRELEEYLESIDHRRDFDEVRDIVNRGVNLDFPEEY